MHSLTLITTSSLSPVGLYDMGMTLIREHLKTAALALTQATTTKTQVRLISQSLVFIQSSSLEVTLAAFGIADLEADRIRDAFFDYCHHRATMHATT